MTQVFQVTDNIKVSGDLEQCWWLKDFVIAMVVGEKDFHSKFVLVDINKWSR